MATSKKYVVLFDSHEIVKGGWRLCYPIFCSLKQMLADRTDMPNHSVTMNVVIM